jgi:tetratricopeptide (TPR) repeat protein
LRYQQGAHDTAAAHYIRGYAYDKLGQRQRSLDAYRQAVAYFKQVEQMSADSYFYLGNAYQQTGQTQEAVAAYQKAIQMRPNFAQPHLSLGVAYMLLGNKRGAMEEYNALKALDPARAERLYKVISGK